MILSNVTAVTDLKIESDVFTMPRSQCFRPSGGLASQQRTAHASNRSPLDPPGWIERASPHLEQPLRVVDPLHRPLRLSEAAPDPLLARHQGRGAGRPLAGPDLPGAQA